MTPGITATEGHKYHVIAICRTFFRDHTRNDRNATQKITSRVRVKSTTVNLTTQIRLDHADAEVETVGYTAHHDIG
jgi:hypothetical protein